MFSKESILILSVGIIAMIVMISRQMKWYDVAVWKSIIVAVALALTGLYGSELWYFVENQSFGGRSFYGSIFFTPITFLLLAFVFRIPYLYSLDFCAPAGCLMLALIKVECLITGCCKGMPLHIATDGTIIRFPSQIAEMINFLVLCVVLFGLTKNKKHRRKIFPLFLILYGITRFILNLFRDEILRTELILPVGNIWSAIAIVIGILWLMILRNKELDEQLARLRQDRESANASAFAEKE